MRATTTVIIFFAAFCASASAALNSTQCQKLLDETFKDTRGVSNACRVDDWSEANAGNVRQLLCKPSCRVAFARQHLFCEQHIKQASRCEGVFSASGNSAASATLDFKASDSQNVESYCQKLIPLHVQAQVLSGATEAQKANAYCAKVDFVADQCQASFDAAYGVAEHGKCHGGNYASVTRTSTCWGDLATLGNCSAGLFKLFREVGGSSPSDADMERGPRYCSGNVANEAAYFKSTANKTMTEKTIGTNAFSNICKDKLWNVCHNESATYKAYRSIYGGENATNPDMPGNNPAGLLCSSTPSEVLKAEVCDANFKAHSALTEFESKCNGTNTHEKACDAHIIEARSGNPTGAGVACVRAASALHAFCVGDASATMTGCTWNLAENAKKSYSTDSCRHFAMIKEGTMNCDAQIPRKTLVTKMIVGVTEVVDVNVLKTNAVSALRNNNITITEDDVSTKVSYSNLITVGFKTDPPNATELISKFATAFGLPNYQISAKVTATSGDDVSKTQKKLRLLLQTTSDEVTAAKLALKYEAAVSIASVDFSSAENVRTVAKERASAAVGDVPGYLAALTSEKIIAELTFEMKVHESAVVLSLSSRSLAEGVSTDIVQNASAPTDMATLPAVAAPPPFGKVSIATTRSGGRSARGCFASAIVAGVTVALFILSLGA